MLSNSLVIAQFGSWMGSKLSLAMSAAILALTGTIAQAAPTDCASLSRLSLPNTKIVSAQSFDAGAYTPPFPDWQKVYGLRPLPPVAVAFCRVIGQIAPTRDSEIGFEVWLPSTGWTGRYESVGNGGFAGGIRYDSMENPLLGGSVVASTDDGHVSSPVQPNPAGWALGHPEKVIDFGYRAVHLTAEVSKGITKAFYGSVPKHSYFVGCSKGGQEGFMEAQRYPADFDGIISGASANQWIDLFSSFAWTANLVLSDPDSYLSPADLQAIHDEVIAQCDAQDGVKDGLINDPLSCHLDTSKLKLSPDKLRTFLAIHAGPKSRSAQQLYSGLPYGGELGWKMMITGDSLDEAPATSAMVMYTNGFFQNFVHQNPAWSFRGFDIDSERATAEHLLGATMNATDLSMTAFRARGGRFVQYAGWADTIVSPLNTVAYYQRVIEAQGARGRSKETNLARAQEFYRLFVAPGVGHCGSGPGPNEFGQRGGNGDAHRDIVVALEKWVENGVAPSRIVATKFVDDDPTKSVVMTRPLCAFPRVAKYIGTGDTNDAVNFRCSRP